MSQVNLILTLTAVGLIAIGLLMPLVPKVKGWMAKSRRSAEYPAPPSMIDGSAISADYHPSNETLNYLQAITVACPGSPDGFKFKQAAAGRSPFEASLNWNAQLQQPSKESLP